MRGERGKLFKLFCRGGGLAIGEEERGVPVGGDGSNSNRERERERVVG